MTFEEEIGVLKGSGLLDAEWYLSHYRDVAALRMDAAEHYLKYGGMMGRDPGPEFNTRFYLAANMDVADKGINALLHYALHGQSEGRNIATSKLV